MVRWIDALNPPLADQSGSTTYEIWGRLTNSAEGKRVVVSDLLDAPFPQFIKAFVTL